MGIEYSAMIIVGLHVDDLSDHERFEEFLDGELDRAPPYYDGGDAAICGICVANTPDYAAKEVPDGLESLITKAKEDFKRITGLEGKVYLTPVGY